MSVVNFNPEIFRAYDIRGIYGKDFDEEFAFQLGAALVKYLNRTKFLVAHDDREFSPRLAEAVAQGMASAGADVEYIGQATTPFFNFVFKPYGVNGGIMVTASHLASEYGGFKVFGGGRIISSHSGLGQLKELVTTGASGVSKYGGKINRSDKKRTMEKYADFIVKKSGLRMGQLANVIFKTNMPAIGNDELALVLQKIGLISGDKDYDIVFTFDGDNDRVNVSDGKNTPVHMDYITGILARDAIKFWHKPKVARDLRFSRGVLETFDNLGIKHFRSPVGWSLLKQIAIDRKADIAGELSGHIMWREANYSELPLLTMLRILKIMSKTGKSINELVEPFRTWQNSGEINIAFSGERLAFSEISEKLKEKYEDGKIDELDGLTVEYPSWWFNLRPSNTESVLRLVVEAKTKNLLDEKAAEIAEIIKAAH